MHHRTPGATLACLEAHNVYLGLIFDLVHVAVPMLRLVWRPVGPRRIVAITDVIAAAGLPDGTYALVGLSVKVSSGVDHLENRALAGSTLLLEQGVRNLGIPLKEALAMASHVPAQSLGETSLGRLVLRAPADLVVLDHQLNFKRTYIAVELCFMAD